MRSTVRSVLTCLAALASQDARLHSLRPATGLTGHPATPFLLFPLRAACKIKHGPLICNAGRVPSPPHRRRGEGGGERLVPCRPGWSRARAGGSALGHDPNRDLAGSCPSVRWVVGVARVTSLSPSAGQSRAGQDRAGQELLNNCVLKICTVYLIAFNASK